MTDFTIFANAVRKQFAEMSSGQLFIVNADRDKVWDHYLASFPPGSNPMFRVRREFDCSCCRSFIRDVGCVVGIQNGAVTTVWDLAGLPEPFQSVANGMSAFIKSCNITDIFITPVVRHGTEKSLELTERGTLTWNHFSVDVPRKFHCSAVERATKMGDAKTSRDMLLRAVQELTAPAIATVMEFIDSNTIYRGTEFRKSVEEFAAIHNQLSALNRSQREQMTWTMCDNHAARFRNSVIGTLVDDLSQGEDLEVAVRKYESKVAPQNYRRSTALITTDMIKNAMKDIQELGLEPALERRHARFTDVSVNSVLFVDNSVRGQMKGGIEALLQAEVRPVQFDTSKAESISIDDFVRDVLPKTTSLQLYLGTDILANMVSLTAPVHEDVEPLFRWRNNFAWSYDGNVADSIKARVKRAGGMVEGVQMRFSLAWRNLDDLDIHVHTPTREHIFFGSKMDRERNGYLDVDMNVVSPQKNAVENVRWTRRPRDGDYKVFVHNYTLREHVEVGFEVEIESDGKLCNLSFDQALPYKREQPVANIDVMNGKIVGIRPDRAMKVGSSVIEKWGLQSESLVRVNSVVLSPNHWDGNAAGNKHWFFILDGCKNPLPTRGIYNEFLHPKLDKHRKVFEVLGDKAKCPVASEQMSGVGFSSTRQDKVTVVAMGPRMQKAYTIEF